MKIYKGKEPCHGCGITGEDKPRRIKNSLCRDCEKCMTRGKAIFAHENIKYTKFMYTWHHFCGEVDALARKILGRLTIMGIPDCFVTDGESLRGHGTRHTEMYVIPTSIYNEIIPFFVKLSDRLEEIKSLEEGMESKAKKMVQDRFDEVYNQGIERGNNLLLSLVEGDVTMGQLTAKTESFKL